MMYPCGIIKDLLPLYIDDVCNEESRQAVQTHLSECETCRKCYEAMAETDSIDGAKSGDFKELEMADSLKQVKKKINNRIARIVFCVVAAAVFCVAGYHLLFNAAIKDVSLEDVTISANVYSVEDLIETQKEQVIDSGSVTISLGENDHSVPVAVKIPDIGDAYITITANTIEKYQSVSVVTVKSDYFLRDIRKDRKDDTIYITAIKTTLMNNKASTFQNNICGLEFGEINRIVYIADDGAETVLWSR